MQIILALIAEALISALFELLILGLGYAIACMVLPPLSFGNITVEPFRAPPARFNWLGYRRKDGHIELAAAAAGSAGLLIGLFACFAIVLLTRALT